MTLPASGPLALSAINTEFGLGTNLGVYRGTTYYYAGSSTAHTFPTPTISISDFYNTQSRPPVTPGTTTYATSGTKTFTIPAFNTLIITLWGGGGGGTASTTANAGAGGDSYITSLSLFAGGGAAGNGSLTIPVSGGISTGGSTNSNGGNSYVNSGFSGSGGNGGNGSVLTGGAGGAGVVTGNNQSANGNAGTQPGGAGGGGTYNNGSGFAFTGSGGGGGACCEKTYIFGDLVIGSTLTISVGKAGTRGSDANPNGNSYGGSGSLGKCVISWS